MSLTKRVRRLLGPGKFIRAEQGLESTLKLFYQLQRAVDSVTSIRIGAIVTSINYGLRLVLRQLVWAGLTGGGLFFYYVLRYDLSAFQAVLRLLDNGWWWVVAMAPAVLVCWRLRFRMLDQSPWDRN